MKDSPVRVAFFFFFRDLAERIPAIEFFMYFSAADIRCWQKLWIITQRKSARYNAEVVAERISVA